MSNSWDPKDYAYALDYEELIDFQSDYKEELGEEIYLKALIHCCLYDTPYLIPISK